jgi:hypothetical protein
MKYLTFFIGLCSLILLVILPLCNAENSEEQTWWQKRQAREDIYYPHNKHEETMQAKGDSCLLCHNFAKTDITDPALLNKVSLIANEALAPICHECHKTNIEAPWNCRTCHPDPSTIWPENHNFDYTNQHGTDSKLDEATCRSCHIDLNFCTDCHFNRGHQPHQVHPLGYRSWHGLDVRTSAFSCGQCHSGLFCQRCHRGKGR